MIDPSEHLGLVYDIAWRFAKRSDRDVDDLVQEGTLGLMRAIEKYDPTRGTFSNHAAWWISAAIGTYLAEDRTVFISQSAQFNARQRGESIPVESTYDFELTAAESPSPEDEAATREKCDRLCSALARLPARDAAVIQRRLQGQTIRETGKALGVHRLTVARTEKRVVRTLQEALCGADYETVH